MGFLDHNKIRQKYCSLQQPTNRILSFLKVELIFFLKRVFSFFCISFPKVLNSGFCAGLFLEINILFSCAHLQRVTFRIFPTILIK